MHDLHISTQENINSPSGSYVEYLKRFPVAVVRIDGRIVAFANIWQDAENEEFSIDLMRYRPDTPHGIMDYLFIKLMLWGKREGYQWFNMGHHSQGLRAVPLRHAGAAR
ncbi:MAG: phosphatidylglycerol lysyltransferase domain-containing protein [Euryarchaeota archaeon]|nr:phosphatidylglycerol lysyltransferase domain-containing protein [Euryarchaeota archaeon]